jgi:hypothetical protein
MGANNFYSIRVNAINPNNQTHLQKKQTQKWSAGRTWENTSNLL